MSILLKAPQSAGNEPMSMLHSNMRESSCFIADHAAGNVPVRKFPLHLSGQVLLKPSTRLLKRTIDEENDGGKTRHSGMDRTSPASRRQATEMGRNTTARL